MSLSRFNGGAVSPLVIGYQNRCIEAAQVISELIELAKQLREAQNLGLTEDEVAFYDALEVNDSAVKVIGATQSGHFATGLQD